ncbi:MAG TPA: hypothetical protein VLM42_02405 [Bryobacteraceae bacterium]|nr:hypothetical protein [Bryobacteraceae bacterium]
MLKDGVVLAVILLIVAGALFLWWTQTPTHYGSPVADTQAQPVEPPKPAPVVVKAKPKPKPEPVVEQAEVPPAAEPVVVAAPPVVHRDPLPFPVVEQIPTGVHEDSITGKYGDPQLSAVTSTGGHMVETMVYARERGRSATVIRIEDGKVSSAYTQTEPVVPPGLSAPRRWHNE